MGEVPLGGTAIASAFILFSPSSVLASLELKDVIEVVRPYLGHSGQPWNLSSWTQQFLCFNRSAEETQ
jgi:hypothetical protein